jgi:thioredoxin reductase (NADPH)
VIGGGNPAVEEALYLTHHASSVTLIHRRDTLKAEKIMQDRLFKNPKVSVIWDSAVEEICGGGEPKHVTHLRLKNLKTGDVSDVPVEGVFVAIGHKPATDVFKGILPMDETGYLLRHPDSSKTDIAGVFVAGDVCDPVYRQAVTAAGMGCMAALDAERFLGEG